MTPLGAALEQGMSVEVPAAVDQTFPAELLTGEGLARMTQAMHTHRRPDGAVRMAREILAGI